MFSNTDFSQKDYTVATLTPWGMAEIKQNYKTLGGSMLYRLIHRAFPKWFKFNSVYVMQPMYLPSMNAKIFEEFGTMDQYCLDPPAPPPKVIVLNSHAAISALLDDQANFKVKYGMQLPDLVFSEYMLQGDGRKNRDNHKFVAQRMMNVPMGLELYAKSFCWLCTRYWPESRTSLVIHSKSTSQKSKTHLLGVLHSLNASSI